MSLYEEQKNEHSLKWPWLKVKILKTWENLKPNREGLNGTEYLELLFKTLNVYSNLIESHVWQINEKLKSWNLNYRDLLTNLNCVIWSRLCFFFNLGLTLVQILLRASNIMLSTLNAQKYRYDFSYVVTAKYINIIHIKMSISKCSLNWKSKT